MLVYLCRIESPADRHGFEELTMKLERIKMLVDMHNRDINIEQMMYSAMQTHKTVALKTGLSNG